jgi:hypothetical protein
MPNKIIGYSPDGETVAEELPDSEKREFFA